MGLIAIGPRSRPRWCSRRRCLGVSVCRPMTRWRRTVLDHELLAETLRQVVGENTCHDVGVTAGGERHDDRHGPRWILVLRRAGTGSTPSVTTVTASLTKMRDGTCFLQPLLAIEARVFRIFFRCVCVGRRHVARKLWSGCGSCWRRSRWLVLSGLRVSRMTSATRSCGRFRRAVSLRGVACVKATRKGIAQPTRMIRSGPRGQRLVRQSRRSIELQPMALMIGAHLRAPDRGGRAPSAGLNRVPARSQQRRSDAASPCQPLRCAWLERSFRQSPSACPSGRRGR